MKMYHFLELKDKTLMLPTPSTATWYNLINGAFPYINPPSSTKKVLVHYHSTYSLTKALEKPTIYQKAFVNQFLRC